MTRIHLATGLALRGDTILLVASAYASHPQPLWNLPGGRQRHGELLHETAVREIFEETGLRAQIGELAYVSESYDADTHVVNVTFHVEVTGEIALPRVGDHVRDACWTDIAQAEERITVRVVREPLLRYLREGERYFGFSDAGVTIRWHEGD